MTMAKERDFRTPQSLRVDIRWPWPALPLGSRIAALGSCFAQNVIERLSAAGFPCSQNPNGILYNPKSIADAMTRAVRGPAYSKADFFQFGGLWHSFSHHGSFSGRDIDAALAKAESARLAFSEVLKSCQLFIATPSSAVVYELLPERRIVANCHKLPGTNFNRRILSEAECLSSLLAMVDSLRSINPSCPVVLTLSPVRHYPGDLVLNARSKAVLLSAIHLCCEARPDIRYFPAYEIVIDELRDYRFFKEDMLHPSEAAASIVLKTFAQACFGSAAIDALDDAERRAKADAHRPLREGD